MHDTHPDIESRVNALFARQTPTQRLKKASTMHQSGVILAKAGLLHTHGEMSAAKLRGHLLVRLYGDCFSSAQLNHIAEAMPDMEKAGEGAPRQARRMEKKV